MSASTEQAQIHVIEETREQINYLVEEIARLSDKDIPPGSYYAEFLKVNLTALAAIAGAVWLRTPQGNLQLHCQINLAHLGLDSEQARQSHDELLRETLQEGKSRQVAPRSSAGLPRIDRPVAGNPTDCAILLAPIVIEKHVAGLVEIWQGADRSPEAMHGFLQFVTRMAGLVARYLRNAQLRQMLGQQQIWIQLETFSRQIHSSLNPVEVAYVIANEGRRLVQADRLSVAVRYGKHATIEAISGADVVEKRSNLVQLMRGLADSVIAWGERLVYSGAKDDGLPPAVLAALDAYLAESNSKLLVVQPLRDERDTSSPQPARSALFVECFEPMLAPEQMLAQVEVIGRHAAPALHNAVEHRRIPMRWLWLPLAKLQDGLGGKARAIAITVAACVALLALAMVCVPFPFKMEASGQLLPQQRRRVYSPVEARVMEFEVQPGSIISEGQPLVLMYDENLEKKLITLQGDIAAARQDIDFLNKQLASPSAADRALYIRQKKEKEVILDQRLAERQALRERRQADENRPGYFWIKAPLAGRVLSSHFLEEFGGKLVKPSEPLLRIGDTTGPWEIEMRIPERHIGQVLGAFPAGDPEAELDVDLLLSSKPERTYRGKLARAKIGGEATVLGADGDAEPMLAAWVRLTGPDIPAEQQVSPELLVTGVEVHAKIRCGNRPMGYSLFYGVWEFLYEKVVFFF